MVCLCWFAHIVGRNIYLKGRVKQRTKKKKGGGQKGNDHFKFTWGFCAAKDKGGSDQLICTGNLIKLYIEKINRNDALL